VRVALPQHLAAPSPVGKGPSTVPQALLDKLKLLPLRERELSTLRQTHQHQQRWIEGTQELMVRLTTAVSIPEALDGLIQSLVQEFGFDISGASTEHDLFAGDAAQSLRAADRGFLAEVIARARESRELVVLEHVGPTENRTLAWLLAGVASTNDKGEGPVVMVGRTLRTAAYFPKPAGEEVGLYRHLLSTLAQVFRSIELQANHHSELERKVAERTAELHEAQKRVVTLEKEKIAEQMAGGFAHEMRNALSGAKLMIEKGMGAGNRSGRSVIDDSADELERLFLTARERLDEEELAGFTQGIRDIARNERLLDETLSSVHRSIQRALAITALIMDYSRIGFSRRGDDEVDLAEIARTVLAESQTSFAQHRIEAMVHAPVPCPLLANESHLYSILKNLIINAFDALCEVEDDRARKLVVEVERTPERIVCRVRDNANGVPEELETRIFEPFFSTKPQTGTGLGLGMVLKLVTLHDGTIVLTSEAGRGTTFTIELPTLKQPSPEPREKLGLSEFTELGGMRVA
jgi:signal transduction histidine kinase